MAYSDSSIDLETVVYVSAASREMSPVGLYGLLTRARESNHNNQITGVLLYAEGTFVQVLEGPRDKLDVVLGKIEQDDRHRDMLVLYRAPIETRGFPDWRMGFQKADVSLDGVFSLTRSAIERRSSEAGEEVFALLQGFYATTYPHAVR